MNSESIDKKRMELIRIKKEIINILSTEELIKYHDLSNEEIQILDEFFEKTNYEDKKSGIREYFI